jgi:hypothetical protein
VVDIKPETSISVSDPDTVFLVNLVQNIFDVQKFKNFLVGFFFLNFDLYDELSSHSRSLSLPKRKHEISSGSRFPIRIFIVDPDPQTPMNLDLKQGGKSHQYYLV